ncbi:MAG: class I SAM-dependent methyltransferase [Paludibacter sp.]|jgi:SAM-dependent methyltransferase|nr:class I SAM-dependent methyltransferase [Paludibacter sp.]
MDSFAHRAADWDQPSKIKMTTVFINELKKNISIESGWKALELGAGTGLAGLQLLPELDSLVAEDTSAAMLEVLQGKLKGDEKVTIVNGEIFDYKQCDIDLLFSIMAFHHLPDLEKALNHIATIIKPGGYMVIGDLMPEDGSFHHFEPIPHKGFEPEEIKMQCTQAGFSVEKLYVYDTLQRERIPGTISDYDQFILVARK